MLACIQILLYRIGGQADQLGSLLIFSYLSGRGIRTRRTKIKADGTDHKNATKTCVWESQLSALIEHQYLGMKSLSVTIKKTQNAAAMYRHGCPNKKMYCSPILKTYSVAVNNGLSAQNDHPNSVSHVLECRMGSHHCLNLQNYPVQIKNVKNSQHW